jgi:hypothetical protein
LAAAAAAAVLAACSGGGSTTAGAGSTPPTTGALTGTSRATSDASTATDAASATLSPSPSASSSAGRTAPTSTVAASGPAVPAAVAEQGAAVVRAIRVADQGAFDRVVLEYTGTFGLWSVRYVDKVTNDPIGDVVPLKGAAFLDVRVQDATFDNIFQVGGAITHAAYTGPHRVEAGLTTVMEIADAGDFEAVMGVGIGVTRAAGFTAYRLSNPSRLVIDIAH